MSGYVLPIEFPLVLSGTDLETSSRIGFAISTEGGEWTPSRSITKWLISRVPARRMFDA